MSKDCIRVLLVEDSPSDARLLCEALEDYPLQRFETRHAARLDEALAFLAGESFDVILQDLNLPDSSGMETCRKIAPAAGQTPVIVLTGADDEAAAAEAMRLGVQDYLVKGQTSASVIGRTIRYAVERSLSQQALREVNKRLQEQAEELRAQTDELTTANEELRESEQALHEAEERLNLAMKSGKVGVWEWTVGTEQTEWSQGIYMLLGYTPGEVRPSHEAFRQRIHPEDLVRHNQTLREAMVQCEDYSCEFRVVWTDGSVHWVEARGQYVYAEDEGAATLRMRGTLSDIDRRKQAEKALRESEERQRRLIDNLKGSHFIYVHDTRGVFQYLGESVTQILGYTSEEFMAHYSKYMTDHPANQAVHRHTELSIRGIRQPPYEVNLWHKDGSTRWLEVQEVPVFDAVGNVIAVEGVAQDITQRKRAEEALRRSEQRLKRAQEIAHLGSWEFDLEKNELTWSDEAYRIFGLEPQQFNTTYEAFLEAVHPEDRDAVDAAYSGSLREGRDSYEIEHRVIRRSTGEVRFVHEKCEHIRDASGRTVRSFGMIHDITERKWMEEALRESEQWFRTLANAMPQLVWTADPDGRVDYYNDRYKEFRGIEPTGDGSFQWAPVVHEEDVAPTVQAWQHAIETGQTYQIEHRVQRADGSYHWYLSRGTPVRDNEGRIVKWFGTATDIDNVKRAEETLRELNATLENRVAQRTVELKRRARQLQKLTLDMSEAEDRERQRLAEILHDDLQQVLAAAKFHLGLMRNQARHDSSLQGIGTEIDQMLREAIEKTRSLSHELNPAVLHQDNLAEMLAWLAERTQAKHGLTVLVRAHGQVNVKTEALKAFLYKAAQELLFNTVKHAGVNEAKIRIRRVGRRICLSVSDRGRGFDVQELGQAAGFGLLSIRERIELLGGRMKIRSTQGKGSTFLIVVPDGEVETEPTGGTQGGDVHRLRVLLADDHEVVREGLASLLGEESNVEVIGGASNGCEAVDMAERLKPDVVIMDVSMPLMSGDEATRQIKEHLPNTRVVALSMSADPDAAERMHRAGAEAYVLKTAPSEELLAAILGD